MLEAEPARQRWWIRPPMPDETLRSIIKRAAALYECPPKRLWECLNWDDPQPYGGIDSPALRVLRRMAIAMGLPPSDLSAQRLPDAPWLLAPQADEVYCPLCWTDDRRRGDPLWFRRGWRRVLRTRCAVHGFPLLLCPEQWTSWPQVREFQLPDLTAHEQRILELIASFGESLERSLYEGAPWPANLAGNPHAARQLLIAVSFNMNKVRDIPLTKCIQTSGNLAMYVHGPSHRQEPVKKLRWDGYREIADPAIRRAGLWIAAWELMRERSDELSPGLGRLPPEIERIAPSDLTNS